MRWLAAFAVLAAGCASDEYRDGSCGTSQPPLACVQHGLASVELAGNWRCAGTRTMTPVDPPGTPITGDVLLMFTFAVDGCAFTSGALTGTVDDTQATASGAADVMATVCATASGELRFTSTASYDASGSIVTTTEYCSLQRQ